jgi:hypothetical protein
MTASTGEEWTYAHAAAFVVGVTLGVSRRFWQIAEGRFEGGGMVYPRSAAPFPLRHKPIAQRRSLTPSDTRAFFRNFLVLMRQVYFRNRFERN